jgi:DNA-binding CsgD family transcriptional regulator
MLLEEFIEQTNAAETPDDVFAYYCQALAKLGFDKVVYTLITDHMQINLKAGHAIKGNYPEDWMQHYTARDYYKIDPVVKYAFKTSAPFTWKQLETARLFSKPQLQILSEAREAGVTNGVGVPLFGARGEMAGVGLASSVVDINTDANTLSKLKLLTEQFHLAYCQKHPTVPEEVVHLTEREIEMLKWWASGKTAAEIGIILNCSEINVKKHIQNIYNKLNANSKIVAIVKAIWLGLIPLDCIKLG